MRGTVMRNLRTKRKRSSLPDWDNIFTIWIGYTLGIYETTDEMHLKIKLGKLEFKMWLLKLLSSQFCNIISAYIIQRVVWELLYGVNINTIFRKERSIIIMWYSLELLILKWASVYYESVWLLLIHKVKLNLCDTFTCGILVYEERQFVSAIDKERRVECQSEVLHPSFVL